MRGERTFDKLAGVTSSATGLALPPACDLSDLGLEVGAVVRFRRPGTKKRWVQGHLRRLDASGSLDVFAPGGGLRTVPASWCERPVPGRSAWEPVVPAGGAGERRRRTSRAAPGVARR